MFIPLNGQQERKIILGLGPNDLTPRSEDKVNNIGFFEDLFGEVKDLQVVKRKKISLGFGQKEEPTFWYLGYFLKKKEVIIQKG